MRTMSKILGLLCSAVLAVTLAGCGSQVASDTPAPSDTPTQTQTQAQPSASATEEGGSQNVERAYYDNVIILMEFSDSIGGENPWLGEPTKRGSWDEVEEADRNKQLEAGRAACESLEQPDTTSGEDSSFLLPWMAANFLCKDQLAAAESGLIAEYSEQIAELLKLSLLKGDTPVGEVLNAVELCGVAVETFYTIPEDMTADTVCWIMRANVNEKQSDEEDFIFMFTAPEAEQEAADEQFSFWAKEIGATPNFLGELAEQER